MTKFKTSFLTVLLFAVAQSAQAGVGLTATFIDNPAAGLDRFIISADSDAGEIINSFAGINIASGVHNIIPGFGSDAIFSQQWASDGANGASLAAWSIYDTYVLFDSTTDFAFSVGGLSETNDGSDPAGLNLNNIVDATEGLGSFAHNLTTDQFTIIPGLAGTSVNFMQVVQPSNTSTFLDVNLFDNTGAPFEIRSFEIANGGVDPNTPNEAPEVTNQFVNDPPGIKFYDQTTMIDPNGGTQNYQILATDDNDDPANLLYEITSIEGNESIFGDTLTGSFDPNAFSIATGGQFSIDPSLVSPWGNYFVNFTVTDSGGLSDTGVLRVNVPEPSTIILAGLGLVGLYTRRRK